MLVLTRSPGQVLHIGDVTVTVGDVGTADVTLRIETVGGDVPVRPAPPEPPVADERAKATDAEA